MRQRSQQQREQQERFRQQQEYFMERQQKGLLQQQQKPLHIKVERGVGIAFGNSQVINFGDKADSLESCIGQNYGTLTQVNVDHNGRATVKQSHGGGKILKSDTKIRNGIGINYGHALQINLNSLHKQPEPPSVHITGDTFVEDDSETISYEEALSRL
jgi:hypothetical protein